MMRWCGGPRTLRQCTSDAFRASHKYFQICNSNLAPPFNNITLFSFPCAHLGPKFLIPLFLSYLLLFCTPLILPLDQYPTVSGDRLTRRQSHSSRTTRVQRTNCLKFTMSTSSSSTSSSSSINEFFDVPDEALPGYSEEDPDMPLHMRERQRRFTTITLREITYPLGCPCHPKDAEDAKRFRRSYSPDSRPILYVPHSRPEVVQRTNSQDSTASNNSNSSRPTRQSLGSFFRRTSS